MRTDLIEARRAKGLTQKQLGEEIGRDQGTVSRYESGDASPERDTALKLAKALGISVVSVIYGPAVAKDSPVRRSKAAAGETAQAAQAVLTSEKKRAA